MRSTFALYLIAICFSIGKFADAGIELNTISTDCSTTRDECDLIDAGQCLVTLPDERRPKVPPLPEDK